MSFYFAVVVDCSADDEQQYVTSGREGGRKRNFYFGRFRVKCEKQAKRTEEPQT
jgi:hypothetical protein